MTLRFKTREQWLVAAGERLKSRLFKPNHITVGDFRVSVGFPRGSHGRGRAIGQCWPDAMVADQTHAVFVCPTLKDPVEVLATLAHEMVHVADECKSKHRGEFKRMALAIGLTGRMTATVPGPEMADTLREIAEGLGEYPHAAIKVAKRGSKGSTLRLFECVGCEQPQKARIGRDEFFATCDICGEPFELKDSGRRG